MADFKIMRNGLNTEIVGDPHIGQSSEDVTVTVTDDGTYSGYTKKLYYSYCYHNEVHRALSAVNSNSEYVIPVQAFFEPGMVKLTVELSNGTNKPACNACFLVVTNGAKDVDASVLPSEKTWQSYIQSYIKSDVYALEKRIDNLILSKGSDSSSEVIDARAGFDGKSYDTLGTAIRTQVNNLNNDIKNYTYYNYEYSENRLPSDIKLEKNKYINRYGKIEDWPGWSLSDYIPVEKNEIYVWTSDIPVTDTVGNIYCGLFNINKEYIGCSIEDGYTLENKKLIKTDNNTAYVRISQSSEYFTDKAMLIRKTLYDKGIKEFIPFKRYLKNSPTKEIEEKTKSFDTNYKPSYDNAVRSIQRIGAGMSYPHHSINAYKEAYKKGFRTLLCDLMFTSDNVPVCFHDLYLNQNYHDVYDANGILVSTTTPIYVKEHTYDELNSYDYGLYMGTQFKDYPLLKFEDMLKLVKYLGVDIYVEIKEMTEAQSKIACDLVRKYGVSERTSWSGTINQLKSVTNNIINARVAHIPSKIDDSEISLLNSLKTGQNKVFVFAWDTTVLNDDIVNKLIENDIAFEIGTLDDEQSIIDYFNRGDAYNYCTGIETNSIVAGKVLLESSLCRY